MIKIRKIKTDDIETLVHLHAVSFASGLERSWSGEDFKTTLATKGMKGFILKHEDVWAAFLLFRQIVDEVEIILLGVDPAFQRLGYATHLLQHAFDIMKKSDVVKVCLEVREDNYAAMHFYEIAGFEEVGLRRDYYLLSDGQKKDAKLYSLDIQ